MNDGYLGYSAEEYRRFRRQSVVNLLVFSFLYMTLYCCRLNLSNAGAVMMSGLGWTAS